jgi:hypothetical protein
MCIKKQNKSIQMDTDDLSREAYNGILIEAEKLTHDLTLQYGLLSYDCKNETEYVEQVEKLTKKILNLEDCELDDLFWGNFPDKNKLNFTLRKIISNIENLKKIPINARHYD